MVHYCKNRDCNNAWIDVDLTNAKSRPPSWKYCKECCDKFGFVNSEQPPKKQLSEKQKEVLQKNHFSMRRKSILRAEKEKGEGLY